MKIDAAIEDLLKKLANKSTMHSKHGCVAIHKGRIVSSAFNYWNQCAKRECPE